MRHAVGRFVRQSPALVVAMLALFVAMGGTAIAAGQALITGKQIKNSSITGADVKNKSLTARDFRGSVRGPRGLQGPAGATGATGAKGDKGDKGDQGIQGIPGPFPASLPAGQTVRGAFYLLGVAGGAGEYVSDSVDFVYPLAALPAPHYIKIGDPAIAQCPGTADNPQAAAGHFCVFEESAANSTTFRGIDQLQKTGSGLWTTSAAAGAYYTYGTWAVTAASGTAGVSATSSGPTS